MTISRTYLVGLAFVLGAAPAFGQVTRDSAGIQIVHNTTPAWTPEQAWRLSEQPVFAIGGGTAAEDKFGRIGGALRLSDGRLVVADETSHQLKFYDASGRHLTSVGGEGRAPGNLDEIAGIKRLEGDSIAVDGMGKATVFAPNGTFARTAQFGPFAPGVLQIPWAVALGRFASGQTVVADFPQGERGPAGAKRWVDSSSVFLADRTGTVVRPLGRLPMVIFAADSADAWPMDFGPQASYASSGSMFYWGFPEDYAIRIYDADWKLQRIVRRSWTPRPFTVSDRDTYVDGWMQLWSKKTGAERAAERVEMQANAYPEFLPAYSAILATSAGELWVREPDLTGAPGCWCLAGSSTVPSRWSVFDPGGRWLGEVTMPPHFLPLEIGTDYVLGQARGGENGPRAVMYRLEKR